MTFGPLHHSSPGSLPPRRRRYATSSPVAGSTSLHSMFGSVDARPS